MVFLTVGPSELRAGLTQLLSLGITLWICIQRNKTPHKAPALVWDLAGLLPSWWEELCFCYAMPGHSILSHPTVPGTASCLDKPMQSFYPRGMSDHPAVDCTGSRYVAVEENSRAKQGKQKFFAWWLGEVHCPACACVHSREPLSSAAGLIYCGQH